MERTIVVSGVILAILFSLICAAILFCPKLAWAADAKHAFLGAEKCGVCHKSDAKGNQLKQWKGSGHARAFEVLASAEAKEVAKEAGVAGDPQKSPACLKCHVTAHEVPAALLGEKFKMKDGVQCESCHGAGGDYAKVPIMKDRAKSVAAGLVIPTEATCKTCHNESAPGFKGFDFKEAWKKIAHKRPPAGPGGASTAK